MLTGLAVCGQCRSKQGYGVFRQHNGTPFGRYACKKAPGWPRCGGIATSEKALDDVVALSVPRPHPRLRLRQPGTDPAHEIAQARRLLRDDQKALEDLVTERYVSRTLSEEHYAKARLALEARIRSTEDTLARLVKPTPRRPEWEDPEKVAYVWGIMTVEERREMLRNAIERVVVHPAKRRGGNVFDPSRVEVVWF